jgi:hypothetical protein
VVKPGTFRNFPIQGAGRAYIRRFSAGSEPGEIDPCTYTEEERDRIIEALAPNVTPTSRLSSFSS